MLLKSTSNNQIDIQKALLNAAHTHYTNAKLGRKEKAEEQKSIPTSIK